LQLIAGGLVSTALIGIVACDAGPQRVRIAAQDFRFDPAEFHLAADRPVELIIVNEGREPHEIASPLLSDSEVSRLGPIEPVLARQGEGYRIAPGQTLHVIFQAPAGTYFVRCRIRGHAGMTSMLIIE
jgi:uncharacterized cupredoxin-like copper-binding protein